MFSASVNYLALGVESQLAMRSTHSASADDMPELSERLLMLFARTGDLELLEAVLTTMRTWVRTRDSLGTALCDHGQDHPCVFGGFRGEAGVSDPSKVERAVLLTNSRNPPIAPITPAASAGRKMVEFFP